MNREIKFRAKDHTNNHWLYGNLATDKTGLYVILPIQDWGKGDTVFEETIGQFTGLYDRNQKPIYEGDIVQWEECVADYTFITQKSEVFYSENSASFEPLNEFDYCDFEVIGNIHDNKELLNED